MNTAAFIPSVALAAGVLLVGGIREQYSVLPRAPMTDIRQELLAIKGANIPIDTAEQRVAGMSQYMLRNYGPDTAPLFTTYVGYYNKQVQGQSIHSPKNCLPGAGWEIRDSKRVPLPVLPFKGTVNRVLLSNHGSNALVYYWYQGRGRIEASEYKVKWNLLRDAALYGRTEETLVRIVVPVQQSENAAESQRILAAADSIATRVSADLSREVERVLPVRPASGTSSAP
jgi:EpsI family protein